MYINKTFTDRNKPTNLSNHFINEEEYGILNFFMLVDGTDIPIQEQEPFSKRWYSHKINDPSVRY